ncbi:hypothetical protein [Tistrella mobilis]
MAGEIHHDVDPVHQVGGIDVVMPGDPDRSAGYGCPGEGAGKQASAAEDENAHAKSLLQALKMLTVEPAQ